MRNPGKLREENPERYAAYLAAQRERDRKRRASGSSRSGPHTHRYLGIYDHGGYLESDGFGAIGYVTTDEVCRFLIDAAGSRDRTLIGYDIDRSVNRWIRDIPVDLLSRLWTTGKTLWRGSQNYRISWLPGHTFTVSIVNEYGETARSATIWDISGFYRCGFKTAYRRWFGTEPSGNRARDITNLFDRTRSSPVMPLSMMRFDGAGAIASALLRDHKPLANSEECSAASSAYFGGRYQQFQVGKFQKAYSYDLNSAYGAALSELPSLSNWEHVKRYTPHPYSCWLVEWEFSDRLITPFPWRTAKQAVCYPRRGIGWYWQPVVDAALREFSDHPGIRIKRGLMPATAVGRPFAFVDRLGDMRHSECKGESALAKIVMASVYGKLIQTPHGQPWNNTQGSLTYAGLVTASVQAKVFRLMARDPGSIISVSTDGVLSTNPDLECDIGTEFGQWRVSTCSDLFSITPGCYSYSNPAGREIIRSSGTPMADWPDAELRDLWDLYGDKLTHRYTQKQFVGLGQALSENMMDRWGLEIMTRNLIRPAPTKPVEGTLEMSSPFGGARELVIDH